MKRHITICLFLFKLIFISIDIQCQPFDIKYSDSFKSIIFQSGEAIIRGEWISPSIYPALKSTEWKHIGRSEVYDELAGIPGNRTTDVFSNSGIEIERHVWISSDNKVVALRQIITNNKKDAFSLNTIKPLSCDGIDGFQLPENPDAGKWSINLQKRRKNEFPETIIPRGNISITADPFISVPVGPDPKGPCLIIGYLDWTKHLAHFDISFKTDKEVTEFTGLNAVCEFNDVLVPPNGSRTTQWIYLTIGEDFNSTVNEYAERVGRYHNVNRPANNAPSVYCSWYWYGKNYSEEYFFRDLQALKDLKFRKPFDVFLIDESWGLHKWGDYMPNDQFPGGMKLVADKINEMGYIPGIWTPPYLVSPGSDLFKKHPEWVIKNKKGDHYTFRMNDEDHLVLDPTYPGVTEYLEESFRKLSEDWGFRYFKFDFMRAVFLDGDYEFFDPYINRLEAYRMGLEAIRRGVGDEAYISVCGGHYGGSLGIADSQRSGSDVVSYWDPNEIPKYRQNILRTWMCRLWHVDPDAMMVRRNEKSEFTGSDAKLSLGLFTDREAQVNALNQYIGGGLVTFTENYLTLDDDRLELYKHIIPSVNSSSYPIDWYQINMPSIMVTNITPKCKNLDNWNTIAIVNWTDDERTFSFSLEENVLKTLAGEKFLLFEFFSQELIGIFSKGSEVNIADLAPHSAGLIKIIPWDGKKPVLAGTDLHFSMGGVEISEWKSDIGKVEGLLETDWLYPVKISGVFPSDGNKFKVKQITLLPGQKRFKITND
jgi:hypothetical protein